MLPVIEAHVQEITEQGVVLALKDGQTWRVERTHIHGEPRPGNAVFISFVASSNADDAQHNFARILLNELIEPTT